MTIVRRAKLIKAEVFSPGSRPSSSVRVDAQLVVALAHLILTYRSEITYYSRRKEKHCRLRHVYMYIFMSSNMAQLAREN